MFHRAFEQFLKVGIFLWVVFPRIVSHRYPRLFWVFKVFENGGLVLRRRVKFIDEILMVLEDIGVALEMEREL